MHIIEIRSTLTSSTLDISAFLHALLDTFLNSFLFITSGIPKTMTLRLRLVVGWISAVDINDETDGFGWISFFSVISVWLIVVVVVALGFDVLVRRLLAALFIIGFCSIISVVVSFSISDGVLLFFLALWDEGLNASSNCKVRPLYLNDLNSSIDRFASSSKELSFCRRYYIRYKIHCLI